MLGTESRPNSDYTRTWSPSGAVEYATLADGTRLRYLKAGSGPALILLHTVRTQLDHFQLVIPQLVDAFTVFDVDFPDMGWSDITRARATRRRDREPESNRVSTPDDDTQGDERPRAADQRAKPRGRALAKPGVR